VSNESLEMPTGSQDPTPVLSYVSKSMNRSQPTTLEDVATRAGVSPGTVSRVLNGKNKENRPAIAKRSERIRRIAMQLGYRPNVAARSMLRGAFRAVAFVTCGDLGNDWYPISALNSIHSKLEASQWRLMFNELPASKIGDAKLVPNLFRETSVDGLIINLLPVFSEDLVEYFESQPLPCVWLNLKRSFGSVYPDDANGAELGVNYLIKRGHKRIGYLSRLFASPTHFSALDRFAGYSSAMAAANLPTHRHLPLLSNRGDALQPTLTMDRARELLLRFPDTEAVFCYEYEEAVCLMVAAERIGRRVPDTLEIVGVHEREIRASSGLSIPTAIIPFYDLGSHAVEMVRQMIDSGNRNIPSVAVPYKSVLI
jgi:DNA-binding LacI/PurR family transcriptional regulator